MKRSHSISLFMALCGVFCACMTSPLAAQTATASTLRVTVFGFLNLTGDESFDVPSETATSNLTFSLRMLNRYQIVENGLTLRVLNDQNLGAFCRANNCDYVLYGTLRSNGENSQKYMLAVYDLAKDKTTIRETEEGSSVLDVFSVTDTLIASTLSGITGTHISFGSVRLASIGGKVLPYEVVIDTLTISESPKKIDYVTSGTHRVTITSVGDDPKELFSGDITVPDGKPATVSFAFPEEKKIEPFVAEQPAPVVQQTAIEKTEEKTPSLPVYKPIVWPKPDYLSEIDVYGSPNVFFLDLSELSPVSVSLGCAYTRYFSPNYPFAFVGRLEGQYPLAKGDSISSLWMMTGLAGVSWNIPINAYFSVQPELDAGLSAYFLKLDTANLEGHDIDKDKYMFLLLQSSLGLRMHKGSIGFEVSPVGTCVLSRSYILGLRCGFLYRFAKGAKK